MRLMPLSMALIASSVLLMFGSCGQTPPDPPSLEQGILVSNAWVRTPPPGLDTTAGYFELTNHSEADRVLVGADSASARTVEFHTTIQDGDMMRMRRLKNVPVPRQATVTFAPGGNHLMLFGFTATPPVTITLHFDDGSSRNVPFDMR